jgi:hypothetical protein
VEFNGVLVMAVLWVVLSLIGSARKKSQGTPRSRLPERPPHPSHPGPPDATQQEGSRLELVLRELQRSLEEAAQPAHLPSRPAPPLEEVDEPASLEVDPRVVSLEGEVHREVRRLVDRDDEAGNFEAQRIQAAADRDSARAKPAHVSIDERIRPEIADHTAARTYSAQQLREAMIWREILGAPVSLRDEGERNR